MSALRLRAVFGAALVSILCVGHSATLVQAAYQGPRIEVTREQGDHLLRVDGEPFMVLGMNWDYVPIGENYLYNFWNQPDAFIVTALEREMALLKSMGVNSVRMYVGVPPRWVRYIYERWGIFTILNHPMARYGYTLDGVWIPAVDYSDTRLREAVKAEIVALIEDFHDTPGVLMWLLGNENNYGLSWSSFEIEALPEGERDAARARHLYSLYGEITDAIHAVDSHRPVAIANGDLQYIDLIAEECKNIDIFGTNVYRGISVRDMFDVVKEKLDRPIVFTEFGADAFNAKTMREDQETQARYLIGQWQEIYEMSAGKGRVGNSIGGMTFQWSDGWWKYQQEENLDVHDTHASWPNGGYVEDFVEGENNMNEEWWGICAKGPTDANGHYQLYPRAAFYALRAAYRLDPYAPTTDLAAIREHFATITPSEAGLQARGDQAALVTEELQRVRVTGLRLELETYGTGGELITTPDAATPPITSYPAFRGFDRMESFYADIEARPASGVTGRLSLNVLGNVPTNPIDEIFYENRGRGQVIGTGATSQTIEGLERVKVYNAAVRWEDRYFTLDGYYRVGHLHWGHEGDFFGLYRNGYYGDNLDIYNGIAPVGVEIAGRKLFEGTKLAFGPQLWWGANPQFLLKHTRAVGRLQATAIYQEEFSSLSTINSTFAIPQPPTRRATLQFATRRGRLGLEAGGIWGGSTKVDDEFQVVKGNPGEFEVFLDEVRESDTVGGKVKLTYERGVWHWYAQAAQMGLVADGGPTEILTYTGWILRDTGSGNQQNFLTGLAWNVGNVQIAPNFLWQKPLVDPIPNGVLPAPARKRNVLDDPFAVRANRETTAAELLLTYDPTPATWMWAWDNDVREDARLAMSLGLVLRSFETDQDASIGILGDGRTTFAFPASTPARDLWEVNVRMVSRLSAQTRLVAHLFAGTVEPNGDSQRLVHRWGADARLATGSLAFAAHAKLNDWGPYDYHRDFNLTFPVQLMGDVSYSLGTPRWFDYKQTRMGIRTTWRTLDEFSPRFVGGPDDGREWEVRTYLHLAM